MIREAHDTRPSSIAGYSHIFKARYIKLDKSYMDVETLVTFLFLGTAQQLTGEIASDMWGQ